MLWKQLLQLVYSFWRVLHLSPLAKNTLLSNLMKDKKELAKKKRKKLLILAISLLVLEQSCTHLHLLTTIKVPKPEFISILQSKINDGTVTLDDFDLTKDQVVDLIEYTEKLEVR